MAERTSNLNLKKPAYSDFADVVDLNDNMDILDEFVGGSPMGTTATSLTVAIAEHETDLNGVSESIGNTPMGTTATSLTGAIAEHTDGITKTRSDIGIVEDTDTATHSIASGQYVIWHGELYKANTAIPSGTALSSTNLSAVTGGGLNVLNEQMANLVTREIISATFNAQGVYVTDVNIEKAICAQCNDSNVRFVFIRPSTGGKAVLHAYDNSMQAMTNISFDVVLWKHS